MKRLYRSRTNKKFLGVCGGLASYFHIDPLLFRLLFIGAFLAGTVGLWIYLILALVTQYNPDVEIGMPDYRPLYRTRRSVVFGVCGGLAKYFTWDTTALRWIFALAALFGIGIFFYIIAAILLPVEPA